MKLKKLKELIDKAIDSGINPETKVMLFAYEGDIDFIKSLNSVKTGRYNATYHYISFDEDDTDEPEEDKNEENVLILRGGTD